MTTPEQRARARDLRLRRQYGITSAQYDVLLAAQGGVCAICETAPKTVLNVDHDHKTGLTRGLLCWHCNSKVIKSSRDRAYIHRRAADYLDDPPAVRVLGAIYGRTGRVTKRRTKRRTTRTTTKGKS